MKKTYQSPETLTVFVNASPLLADSPVENGFDMNNPKGSTGETSGNLSRRSYSVWDDEELEEEDY